MVRLEPPSVSVSRRGSARGDADRTVVWVRGDNDIATMVNLRDVLDRAARLEDVPLLIDLSGVTFMDASTAGALVESRTQLASRGQSLEVRAPSSSALRVLDLCGLTHLVHGAPLPSTGMAPALSTWVEVRPTGPSEPAGRSPTARARIEEAARPIGAGHGRT